MGDALLALKNPPAGGGGEKGKGKNHCCYRWRGGGGGRFLIISTFLYLFQILHDPGERKAESIETTKSYDPEVSRQGGYGKRREEGKRKNNADCSAAHLCVSPSAICGREERGKKGVVTTSAVPKATLGQREKTGGRGGKVSSTRLLTSSSRPRYSGKNRGRWRRGS